MASSIAISVPQSRKAWPGVILSVLRYAVAACILVYFLIPNYYLVSIPPVSWVSLLAAPKDATRLIMAATGIGLTSVMAYGIHFWFQKRPVRLNVPLVAVTVAYLASLALTAVLSGSRTGQSADCCSIAITTCLGLLAALLCGSAKISVRILVLVVVVQSALAVCDFFLGTHVFLSGIVRRAEGTYLQPTQLARVALLCLPMAIVLFEDAAGAFESSIWTFAIGVLLTALLLTLVRGAAIAACLSVTWVVWRLARAPRLPLVIGVILLAMSAYVCVARSSGDRANLISSTRSAIGHVTLAKRGWNIFIKHPISGVGVSAVYLPVEIGGSSQAKSVLLQPKNEYLFWLDEYGLAGIFLIVGFAFSLRYLVKYTKSKPSIALAGAWIAWAIHSLADTPFGIASNDVGNVLFGALIGSTLLLCAADSEDKIRTHENTDASTMGTGI